MVRENIFLVEPNKEYKDQFAEMVQAYKDFGEIDYYDMCKVALDDFNKFVQRLQNNSKGIEIPDDWVTTHTFWLTDDEGRLLGTTRVRPENDNEFVKNYAGNIGYDISPLHRQKGYGTIILKLALEKAKFLGMDRVLITCNYDNIGSIKIIEGNGGIFEAEVFCESKNTLLRRYWIAL